MKTDFFSIEFICIYLLFLLVAGCLFLFILLRNELKDLRKTVTKNGQSKKPAIAHNPPGVSQDNKYPEILERLKKLELLVSKKAEPVAAAAPTFYAEEEKPVEVNLSVHKKNEIVEFYMSTPNLDGYFETEQRSDTFRPTISLYKFRVDAGNPSKAYFEFHSDESGIKDALSNPKRYIEPVCYEENDAFAGAKKIAVQKEGVAVKVGDKWMVDKNSRAKIKYQ